MMDLKMSFTDDDLKRLKRCTPHVMSGADIHIAIPEQIRGLGKFERFNLTALLARLEAAEKAPSNSPTCSCSQWCDECSENEKAWREAAGRNENYKSHNTQ